MESMQEERRMDWTYPSLARVVGLLGLWLVQKCSHLMFSKSKKMVDRIRIGALC
jgi:hypothetical protein